MPSQKISFTRSARFARNTYTTPENGSVRMVSRTSAASSSAPFRKSTGFVATKTWTFPVGPYALKSTCVGALTRSDNQLPTARPKGAPQTSLTLVLHSKALLGNPFDSHTLRPVITELEQQTGAEARRIHVDKGYRRHNQKEKFRVWISGPVRRVTAPIRCEMKRRATVEPVIGHTKVEHRMGRYYLKGRDGDRSNAVLSAPITSTSSYAGWPGFYVSCSRRFFSRHPARNLVHRL